VNPPHPTDRDEASSGAQPGWGAGTGARARVRTTDAILGGLGVVAVVVIVAVPYLSVFGDRGLVVPIGADTTTYIWRSNVVIAEGLNALPGSSPYPFDANTSNPDRTGLPVLAAAVDATTGIDPWRLSFVLPAVCAVIAALAAGAVGVAGHGDPRWSFAVYGLALGLSAPLVLAANGYLDNLLVYGTLLAATAVALVAADGRPGVAGAAFLLAASFTIHWFFAALFAAILLGSAALLAPGSVRSVRRGARVLETPSGRVGAAALLGSGLGFGFMLLTPGSQAYTTRTYRGYREKLDVWLELLRFPTVGLAAALGVAGLASDGRGDDDPGRPRRRRALALWAVWLLTVAVAYIAFEVGVTIPVQRIVGFALPLWVLAAAGGVWLTRAAWRWGTRPSQWLGVVAAGTAIVVVIIGIAATYRTVERDLEGHVLPSFSDPALAATLTATAPYLASLPPSTPVVVPVDLPSAEQLFGVVPSFRRLRALAPPDRAEDVLVYLGDPERLLAGEPTTRGDPEFDDVSLRYWAVLEPLLEGRQAVVLAVAPFTKGVRALSEANPEGVVTEGVVVLEGPDPPGPRAAEPLRTPSGLELAGNAARVFLLLAIVGAGWAFALLGMEPLSRAALAPAAGVAALALVGFIAGRAGVPLGRSAAAPLIAALLGWGVAGSHLLRRRRRDRRDPPSAAAPDPVRASPGRSP
jgi:hypothetical protein